MNNAKAIIRPLLRRATPLNKKETTLSDLGFLVIASQDDRLIIEMSDILFLKADSNYTIVQTATKKHIVAKTLKWFTDKMDHRFYRIHQSFIINVTKINKYLSKEQVIVLNNGSNLPLSRSKKKNFLDFLT